VDAVLARVAADIWASLARSPVAGRRSDDLREGDTEAGGRFIHNDHLAARNHAAVYDHIDRLADPAIEGDDSATPEFDEARDGHRG